MAWEDNRNKSIRDIKQEERLEWLRKQIAEMEGKQPQPSIQERIRPRIRRNGVFVESKVG